MDWNDEMITRLGALWDEGHSTAEIGRRMGITKNAVVGKAHRLNLKPRPSPIRWAAAEAAASPAATVAAAASRRPAPSAAALPPRLHSMFHPVAASKPVSRTSPCCWPIGEPGTPSFRFCDAAAANGRPYCAQHAQLAYVKVRDRREEAA